MVFQGRLKPGLGGHRYQQVAPACRTALPLGGRTRCPGPRSDALLKPAQRRVLRLAPLREAVEGLQARERVVTGPRADGGAAVALDEVSGPDVAVVRDVEQDQRAEAGRPPAACRAIAL